ncbi:MAG TPA: hypothetical protein VFX59_23800 [Polyangiales bacterium]|nr:hypothetical protein [Polyangiales bacterium]
MRLPLLALPLLVGCGSVRLGDEEPLGDRDFDAAGALDGGGSLLNVVVTLGAPDAGCGSCVELSVRADNGTAPYTFEWEDGNKLPSRVVCMDDGVEVYEVVAHDASGRSSAPYAVRLGLPERACVDASVPRLCIENGSFEGKVAVNTGMVFDVPPWSDCTNPSRPNFPHVLNDSVVQWVTKVPAPTDGVTFVGLQENDQTSQALCEPVRGGELRYFTIDARKLDISNATGDNKERIFLAVSGGVSANCLTRELLWVSPSLGMEWQSYCVTMAPQQYMDRLVLEAWTDGSAPLTSSVMVVDNLQPVAGCP